MAKYKVRDSYKSAKNKHFNIGTTRVLERGGTLQMEEKEFEKLPEDVKEHLELLNKPKPKKVSKPDTKKKKKENK